MNGDAGYESSHKPLPPPAVHEKLPAPLPCESDLDWTPPSISHKAGAPSMGSPCLNASGSQLDLSTHRDVPRQSSQSAAAPPSPGGKRSNPLADLIDTEKGYVDLLAGIIRKVAGAWSRSNMPPPELDIMFRSIERIYKANRSLLSKLKEIGSNPSSPKALGDLLMRWVDDLETPYTAYCTNFLVGFDAWEPVQGNDRLRTVLAMFSSSNPPPLPPTSPLHPSEPPMWTLDKLFLMPKERLMYYRRLYSRLLKGTSPGRSDHRLLSSALEKLEGLQNILEGRVSIMVASVSTYTSPRPPPDTDDEVAMDSRGRRSLAPHGPSQAVLPPELPVPSNSKQDTRDDSYSNEQPEQAAAPPSSPVLPPSVPLTVAALERRLSAERTLDIFTMKPRQTHLQLSPPTLHYTREVRLSADVVVRFTPGATGTEVVHELGHVFILTDLFVLCERMRPRERAQFGPDGPDLWLVYPPLTGKHLRVAPVNGSETALAIVIMRKETLVLHTSTPAMRDRLCSEFAECIDAAAILSSSTKSPPSAGSALLPLDGPRSPPLGPQTASGLPGQNTPNSPPSTGVPAERLSGSMSPSSTRTPSGSYSPPFQGTRSSSSSGSAPPMEEMARLALDDAPQTAPAYPTRTTSMSSRRFSDSQSPGRLSRQPSFGVGQVVPSQFGGQQPPMPSFRPGQVMHQQGPPPMQLGPGGSHQPFGQVMPPMGGRPPAGLQSPYRPVPGMGPQGGPSFQQGGPPSQQSGPPLPFGVGPGMPPAWDGVPGQPGSMISSYREPPLRSASSDPPQRTLTPVGPPGPSPHPPFARPQNRAPSDPSFQGGLRKSTSSRSLRLPNEILSTASAPPMPTYPGDLPPPNRPFMKQRNGSTPSLHSLPSQLSGPTQPTLLPSEQLKMAQVAARFDEPSPPGSPVAETRKELGPTSTSITAQMKCKVFLQQQHAQWKSLGAAKLKLYRESPTNVKQLVVEADDKKNSVLVSTIVLEDGVERVGKTGVAVELSDRGRRSGIIYMLQLRNEKSAGGLFDSLIAGSDRSGQN